MPSPPLYDRRRSERLPYAGKIAVTWEDGTFQAHSANLSRAGLFIETTTHVAVGTTVRVEFEVSGASGGQKSQRSATRRYPVAAEGEVIRLVTLEEASSFGTLSGIGIEFERFMEGEVAVENFVRAKLSSIRPPRPSNRSGDHSSRAPVNIPVSWGIDASLGRAGHLRSLDTAGAFLEVTEPAPAGTIIHLEFELLRADSVQSVSTRAVIAETHPPEGPYAWGLEIAFERDPEAPKQA
jgi:hypothetical protein